MQRIYGVLKKLFFTGELYIIRFLLLLEENKLFFYIFPKKDLFPFKGKTEQF
jgi:hypothetical protein